VLAARLIRIVNSPLYRSNNQITSVKRALLFIGFKSIREMLLTSYFVAGFKQSEQPFEMKMFWIHSFSVGAVSRLLARMSDYADLEKAYLVGILHDIGKVFLGNYHRDKYGAMLNRIIGTDVTTYDAEYETFGTTHCEVGLCLALRWNFPPEYCDIISHHHTSEMATEDPFLAAIVALADYYCLSHNTCEGFAQARTPGQSEEHAWEVLKQNTPLQPDSRMENYLSELDREYEAISLEVNQLFNSMTAL
jgi:putative nucleotidyltransferase with HDIG domain